MTIPIGYKSHFCCLCICKMVNFAFLFSLYHVHNFEYFWAMVMIIHFCLILGTFCCFLFNDEQFWYCVGTVKTLFGKMAFCNYVWRIPVEMQSKNKHFFFLRKIWTVNGKQCKQHLLRLKCGGFGLSSRADETTGDTTALRKWGRSFCAAFCLLWVEFSQTASG